MYVYITHRQLVQRLVRLLPQVAVLVEAVVRHVAQVRILRQRHPSVDDDGPGRVSLRLDQVLGPVQLRQHLRPDEGAPRQVDLVLVHLVEDAVLVAEAAALLHVLEAEHAGEMGHAERVLHRRIGGVRADHGDQGRLADLVEVPGDVDRQIRL